jgi:hypothetical protein
MNSLVNQTKGNVHSLSCSPNKNTFSRYSHIFTWLNLFTAKQKKTPNDSQYGVHLLASKSCRIVPQVGFYVRRSAPFFRTAILVDECTYLREQLRMKCG